MTRLSGHAVTRTAGRLAALLVAGPLAAQAPAPAPAPKPTATYRLYVANESSDIVSRVRFGPDGMVEEKQIPVGRNPMDIDGAHGIAVAPNGRDWYVSLAHGLPYGQVWRMEAGTDTLVDSVTVGLFPATMGLTPDGSGLFVVNFNLHGNMVPSSVSAVFTPFMTETKQITTCTMPHGSRLTHDGRFQYSVCMMDDQLVEIATDSLGVTRRLGLTPGHEGLLEGGMDHRAMDGPRCKPTWVAVAPDDRHVYVPCNGHAEILEIDRGTLAISRRFPTGTAPYNADVSADGRWLVTTLKGAQAVSFIDLRSGTETRLPTTQPVTHGVVVSPDSRYAFVSNEAIGATRSTVDVFDLPALQRVASVEVQYQAGGIGFWRMEKDSE